MEQTSRLRIIIDASNAERSINNLKTGLQGLQDQAQNAVSALSRLQNNSLGGLVRSSGAVNQLNQNVRQTQNIFNQTNNVLNRTSNVFNQVNNTVNRTNNSFTRMGDTINRNTTIINNYNNSVNRTSSSLSNLNGVLSGTILGSLAQLHSLLVGSAFAMAGLSVLKTADAMQSLDSQIKLVTKSEEEYLTVRQKVREIADKNYADIEATTNLYQNSARALANLGKTQQEALVFTNAVSLAMRTGGKSALEQKSALYQLGQAMQSGVLNGDEFRSISENAPILLDLVAKKLNVTRGEVKQLSKEGEITAELIYETLATATPKLEEMAKKMPITMGQAFALVRNKYKEFIGDFMNNDTGLSGVIAKSLVVASNHFNTFAKVAVAGAGVAMLGLTNRILTSGKAMTTLATIMKAHPIFAMASVVMAVSTANRGLEATLDDLGKSLSMVGLMIKDTVNLFSELGSTAYQIFKDITSNAQDTTQTSSQLFGGFFSDTGSGFTGLMHGTAKTFDAMATTVKTFGKLAGENLAYFVTNAGDLFKIMANNTAHIFENIVNNVVGKSVNFIIEKINGVLEFSNSLSEKLGIEPMALLEPYQSNIKFGRFNVGRMTKTRTWAELFDENAEEQMRNGALSWTQSLEHRANAAIPNANLNNPMGEYQKPKDKDKDKKKKESQKDEDFSNRPLQLSIYRALVDEGASSNQALAIVAEVGRENNFNADLVFGTHTDPARDKNGKTITNYGMISWNRTRAKELMKFLEQGGAIKNGKMVRSQETLRLQARFLLKEALERKDKLAHFFANPDADPESFARELGKHLIGWAYGQSTIPGKNGGRVAFDWLKHDQRRRNHLKNTTNLVNNSGYKGGRSVQDNIKDYQEQQKNYNDLISQLLKNPLERLNDELKMQIDAIHANTIATADEKQRMIERATQMHDGKASAMKAEAILQHQGYLLNDEDKAYHEFHRDAGKFYADPNADLSQAEAYIKILERARDVKLEIAFIDKAERELEANRHKMTAKEILDAELSIDFRRKELSGEYTEEQLDSIKEFYSKKMQAQDKVDEHKRKSLKFEIEQYSMNVFQKIEAERQLAHLQLETSEQMNITELAWHKEAIDAKYDYEVKKAKEARDKIFNDAKNDYARQIHLLQNPKDPYAGVRYDLKNDKENKYTDEEIAKHIEMLKKQKQLSDYVQAQERYGMAKFAPTEHKDYWGAFKGVAEMGQQILGDYGLYKDQHKNEKNYLKEQLDASLITEEEYHAKREEMAKRHHEAMALFAINGTSGILTNMAQMAKYTIGEQSKTYRTLYQMGKAFALAQAGIAVYKAGADAWANETGTVWQKAVASALAVAKTSQFVQLISSANPQGFATGGYTGNVGTSQIAGVVHGQEYVLNAQATKRIGVNNLNRLNNGDGIGGGVNVIINNHSNEKATAQQMPNGDVLVTIGKMMKEVGRTEAQKVVREELSQGGSIARRLK